MFPTARLPGKLKELNPDLPYLLICVITAQLLHKIWIPSLVAAAISICWFQVGQHTPSCVEHIGHEGPRVWALTYLTMEFHCELDMSHPTEVQLNSYTPMLAWLHLGHWKIDILNHCLRYYCLQQTVWILSSTEAAEYPNSEVIIKPYCYFIMLCFWIAWDM